MVLGLAGEPVAPPVPEEWRQTHMERWHRHMAIQHQRQHVLQALEEHALMDQGSPMEVRSEPGDVYAVHNAGFGGPGILHRPSKRPRRAYSLEPYGNSQASSQDMQVDEAATDDDLDEELRHMRQKDTRPSPHPPGSPYVQTNRLLYELHLTRLQNRRPPPWPTPPGS